MLGRPRNNANQGEPHDLDGNLLEFQHVDPRFRTPWTVRDSFEGTQVFGATGSGKTSGSGYQIAHWMLKKGYGGLVLTVKPDDTKEWVRYAAETGRGADLRIVQPGAEYHFNFLRFEHEYHRSRGTNLTQNLVALFCNAMEAGQERDSTTDPYWEDSLRQLLTNAIDLVTLATGTISMSDIVKVIRTAPQTRSQAADKAWQESSICWKHLAAAEEKTKDAEARADLDETLDYWTLDFAGLAERTRSVVVSSFTSKATALLRRPLRSLFCNDAPDTISPDDTHRGRIVVLNLPVKEYSEAGRFAQIIFKTVWQRATERRNEETPGARPVFLWADEAQHFVTSHDMLFQQTARTKRAATVYLTQNISNYYAQLNSRHGTASTDSLLGNLQTKIFHANGDPATNEWAERVFAKKLKDLAGSSISMGENAQLSRSKNEQLHPVVPAHEFTTLRTGGPFNEGKVEAFVFKAGKTWAGKTREHFARVQFQQPKLRSEDTSHE